MFECILLANNIIFPPITLDLKSLSFPQENQIYGNSKSGSTRYIINNSGKQNNFNILDTRITTWNIKENCDVFVL